MMTTVDNILLMIISWNKYAFNELLNCRSKLLGSMWIFGTCYSRIYCQESSNNRIDAGSCERTGTRYNTRRINDDGSICKLCEDRNYLAGAHYFFSYIQIRSS